MPLPTFCGTLVEVKAFELVSTMTPPCHSFPVSQLQSQIQINVDGKKRKTEGGKAVELSACELLDLVQYRCEVEHPNQRNSPVLCYPVQRWFRR